MENKKLLEAIDDYQDYTLAQRKILKMLIEFTVNDTAIITPARIVELLKTTRQTVYTAIKRFSQDNFIILDDHTRNEKITKFKINKKKLDEIIQRFEKLKNFDPNSKN